MIFFILALISNLGGIHVHLLLYILSNFQQNESFVGSISTLSQKGFNIYSTDDKCSGQKS